MAVHTDISQLKGISRPIVTIGTFDGVHAGHKAILSKVVTYAREVGGESVLLTFEPHPRKVLFPTQPLGIITPLQRKTELIAATGIQHIVVVPFTKEFAALSAEDYIKNVLVDPLRPHTIIIGYDHHFGHDRTGNIDLLRRYAPTYGYNIVEIPAQLIDQATVSSTKIRKAILAGHIAEANTMLGREYTLEGTVVHGKKLGRELGYPTANIAPLNADQVVPGIGIYAVRVRIDNVLYGGMMSIGLNPTVSHTQDVKLEVNIFDIDADLYGQVLEIGFADRLRNEQKFSSLEELIAQLHADKAAAMAALG
ncbi:bifunctional riboflavin kinase/FAD synthetase [Nemorincola caseinilytica]|uniref:Riboflavin biosynthesis protein n=1 Tax=Nemorincola caseinilytica TaxID=2054315 RepID=A0ABP8NS53_9BACT